MAPSIGLNLRVTGYCNQGGRKYMEDVFSVAYQQTEDEKDLEYAFFGIFDGHGGREAAVFAKEHLMDFIVKQKIFWADDDESVLRAIREGFIQTHQAMWGELEKWPKTVSGLPSTAGTTASIAFIRRGKIYIGHVGDSAIVLGFDDSGNDSEEKVWKSEPLTRDHKPESDEESKRIEKSGGKVICKSGVPRVVWNRPKMGHKGPVRRSTHIDEIPFLAVARSLGDLWSYNSEEDVFVVSPEPDTYVYPIDITKNRCLILGTDGAWNMLTPAQAVAHVCQAERSNEQHMLYPHNNVINGSSVPTSGRQWINPSKYLVDRAIERWQGNNLRADNTSIVTVMLDPPGPPRAQVLKRQRELAMLNRVSGINNLTGAQDSVPGGNSMAQSSGVKEVLNRNALGFESRGTVALVTNTDAPSANLANFALINREQSNTLKPEDQPDPSKVHQSKLLTKRTKNDIPSSENPKSISIISRFPNSRNIEDVQGHGLVPSSSRILHDFQTSGTSNHSVRRPLPTLPNSPQDNLALEKSSSNSQGASSSNILSAQSRAALNRLTDGSSGISGVVSTVTNADSCSASVRRGQRNYPLTKSSSGEVSQNPNMIRPEEGGIYEEIKTNSKSSFQNRSPLSESMVDVDEDSIQINEISSSDDEKSPIHHILSKPISISNVSTVARGIYVSSTGNKHLTKVLKETRLSRELNALQLDSPCFAPNYTENRRATNAKRRNNLEMGDHNQSDTENEEQVMNRPREKRHLRSSSSTAISFPSSCDEKAVLEQCQKLNNRIRNMERKVAKKTEELNKQVRQLQSALIVGGQCSNKHNTKYSKSEHFLRSTQSIRFKPSPARRNMHGSSSSVTSQIRSLRSNTSPCIIPKKSKMTPITNSSRKRKIALEAAHHQSLEIQPAKSPRTIASSVVRASAINKQPIIHTRSRRARVLHLKK